MVNVWSRSTVASTAAPWSSARPRRTLTSSPAAVTFKSSHMCCMGTCHRTSVNSSCKSSEMASTRCWSLPTWLRAVSTFPRSTWLCVAIRPRTTSRTFTGRGVPVALDAVALVFASTSRRSCMLWPLSKETLALRSDASRRQLKARSLRLDLWMLPSKLRDLFIKIRGPWRVRFNKPLYNLRWK